MFAIYQAIMTLTLFLIQADYLFIIFEQEHNAKTTT